MQRLQLPLLRIKGCGDQQCRKLNNWSRPKPTETPQNHPKIRGMREAAALEGRPSKALVYVKPEDNLAKVG
jgi:hypothetical protein